MKTTIEIPDPLYRQAKIRAIERGQSLKKLVITSLQRELDSGKNDETKPKTFAEKRRLRPGFKRLWESGALSGGTDSTQLISEDRSSREDALL